MKTTMCKIYYPLLDEMIRTRGIKKSAIAARLNISEKTLYNKLSGVTDLWLSEANLIQRDFFPDVPKDELFQKAGE